MKKSTKSSTRTETFIDTSGFYALLVKADDRHSECVRILAAAAESGARFVTSDYILDETATLLRARGEGAATINPWFESIFASRALRVEWMDPERFAATRQLFVRFHDKGWSFTDCFSFHLMRHLRMQDALTKDEHFRQAGFNPLLI